MKLEPRRLFRALLFAAPHIAPSHEVVLAAEDARDGLGVGDVLLFEYASREAAPLSGHYVY